MLKNIEILNYKYLSGNISLLVGVLSRAVWCESPVLAGLYI